MFKPLHNILAGEHNQLSESPIFNIDNMCIFMELILLYEFRWGFFLKKMTNKDTLFEHLV